MDCEPKCVYPVSFAQQRLLFLTQFDPKNIAYNVSSLYRIVGKLDAGVLERCLSEIVSRHDILRTVFENTTEGPRQRVVDLKVPLRVLDLSEVRERDVQAKVNEETQAITTRPYDLIQGPLARFTLITLGEEQHLLHIAMHHIITDGWSSRLLLKELVSLYGAFREGKASPLEPLSLQYGDFAELQREWLKEEALTKQLDYWREKLQGVDPVDLPRDYARPVRQTYRGNSIHWDASIDLTTKLKALATSNRATLFMVMLAAVKILIARLSQQQDVVVGIPIANRTRSELEGLIGFFVNTLALRTDLSNDPTFRDLLTDVRDEMLQAYSHQDLPFEKLVEELQPERDLSRNPIYQIFFAFQNLPSFGQEVSGLKIDRLPQVHTTAMTDLDIYLSDESNSLKGIFVYNTALFKEETVKRFIGYFETMLEGIVADADCVVSRIPLLVEDQLRQLTVDWNATETAYPDQDSLVSLFEQQVARTPHRIALQLGEEEVSYAKLNARVNQLAHHLRSIGLSLEDPVGICLERSIDQIVAVLGILKAGGSYVPLDPDYPKDRIKYMLDDSGARILIGHSHLHELYAEYAYHTINMDLEGDDIRSQSDVNPSLVCSQESAAYIIYTSGSTGLPKGVIGLHRGAVNRCNWMWRSYPFNQEDVCSLKTRISFVDSVWELFGPLLQGTKLTLLADEVVKDSTKLVESLASNRVTRLILVPSLLRTILENESDLQARLPDLKFWVTSGEALTDDLFFQFRDKLPGCRLLNLYGSSEVSADVTACELTLDETRTQVTIGRPIDNTTVYVIDQNNNPMPIGVPGEIYVGGAGLARGYLNRADLTASRFVDNWIDRESNSQLFKTGDLGRYLANGEIEYLGRADSQVKLRGFRIELGEIESVLEGMEGIRTATVIVKEKPIQQLMAFYTLERGATTNINKDMMRDHVGAKLPHYMVPGVYHHLKHVPLTPSGKIDRLALLDLANRGKNTETSKRSEPNTDIEFQLRDIWQEVLQTKDIGTNDNFFELGGHSLLAMSLIARINKFFGKSLAVVTLFEAPSIQGLAKSIEKDDNVKVNQSRIREKENGAEVNGSMAMKKQEFDAGGPLVLSDNTEDKLKTKYLLSYSQRRLWFLEQLDPGNIAYNLSFLYKIRGKLDSELLERCLSEIVSRHNILRTVFENTPEGPRQCVVSDLKIPLRLLNLSDTQEQDLLSKVNARTQEIARRPYDLTRGPLVRFTLIQAASESHFFHIAMHHIITDGWSSRLLLKEIIEIYEAFRDGLVSPLEPLPLQYGEFSELQREWLKGEALAEQLNYWTKKLRESQPLDLPTDFVRPARQTFEGSSLDWTLSASLTNNLKKLATRQKSTLFMVLLAALKILLARLSQNPDVVIGIPIANRSRPELESLIGFFVNTLALRSDLSNDPTFIELLDSIREDTLEAYSRQDLPFEKLVEELQPERDLSRNPIFQIFFAFQNLPNFKQQIAELSIERSKQTFTTVMTDLDIYMSESSDSIRGTFAFNTSLFKEETIKRFIGHFKTVLEGIVAAPNSTVSKVPLLNREQTRQLTVEWNATEVPRPESETLVGLFEKQVAKTPDGVALRSHSEEITYAKLNALANQVAHYLRNKGLMVGDPVGVCLERSIDQVVAIIGILKSGGAYVPLDPDYPSDRIRYMLNDSDSRILITASRLSGLHTEFEHTVVFIDRDREKIFSQSDGNLPKISDPGSAAYIIYTSGSTGLPKGVIGIHRGAVNRCHWMWQRYPFEQGEVCCLKTRISFVDSVWELFGPLLQGIPIVLISDEVIQDSALLVRELAEHKVSRLVLVPSLLRAILESENELRHRIPSLQFWVTSGEALTDDLFLLFRKKLPGCRLLNLYGSSEVSADVTSCELTLERSRSQVTLGRPIDNSQIFILDQHYSPMPIGVTGEIYVGGDGLARGYLNRPDLTADRFLNVSFNPGAQFRLFRTGDLGRFLANGEIDYIGRADSQIKLRGFRVELGEIESVLEEIAGIRTVIVIVKDKPIRQLIAFYAVEEGTIEDISESSIDDHAKAKLPRYMVPAAYHRLDAVPLTPSGKVNRLALLDLANEGKSSEGKEIDAPTNDIEVRLLDIWQEVLQTDDISINDNFFDLGGHSLLAMDLIAKVNKEFGKSLAVVTMFEAPTIKEQGRSIGTEQGSLPKQSLVRVKSGSEHKIPLILVHDVDGEAILYYGLSQSVHQDRPVYVLRPLCGEDCPMVHTRIPDMAAHYIHEIKQQFPKGPYILGGLCAGGVIAFEIACQLQAKKEEVALVAIIDALEVKTKPVYKNWSTRLAKFLSTFDQENVQESDGGITLLSKRKLSMALQKIGNLLTYEILTKSKNLYNRVRADLFERCMKAGYSLPFFLKNIPVAILYLHARRRYSPGKYIGQLVLFRATEAKQDENLLFDDTPVRMITADPSFGWDKRATQGVHAEDIPGGHSTMLQDPNVTVLGEKLESLL